MAAALGSDDYGREGHTCVLYNNNLFIFGGIAMANNGESETNSLLSYDLATKKWTDYSNIKYKQSPLARSGHTAVIYNDSIYIYGGLLKFRDNEDKLKWQACNELWRFNIKNPTSEDAWTRINDNNINYKTKSIGPARYRHSAIMFESYMIIIGGLNDNPIDQTVSTSMDAQNAVPGMLIIDLNDANNLNNSQLDGYFIDNIVGLGLKETRIRHTCNLIYSAKKTDAMSKKSDFHVSLVLVAGEDYVKILQNHVITVTCQLLDYDPTKLSVLDIITDPNNWKIEKFGVNLSNGALFDRFGHTSVVVPITASNNNDKNVKNSGNNNVAMIVYGGYGNTITNDCYLVTIKVQFADLIDSSNNNNGNNESEMKGDDSTSDNSCNIGKFDVNCIELKPKQTLETRHGHTSIYDSDNGQIIHFGGKKGFGAMVGNNGEIQRMEISVTVKETNSNKNQIDCDIKQIVNDSGKEIQSNNNNNNNNGGFGGGFVDPYQAEQDELQQILLMSMIDK